MVMTSSTCSPSTSAWCMAAAITGPSAMGSENGMPISTICAPAASRPRIVVSVASSEGCRSSQKRHQRRVSFVLQCREDVIDAAHSYFVPPGPPSAMYFRWIALVRSTSVTLASVASHARTSGELFSEVVRIAIATGLFGECFGKFSELFGEPEEGRGDAAGGHRWRGSVHG